MPVDLEFGIDRLQRHPSLGKDWGKCAFLYNQASVTKDLVSSLDVCKTVLGKRLTALFGPQHGVLGTRQDNMIETRHNTYDGLPQYSLYSETREPSKAMLQGVDTILVDLQISGCRVYTYKATMAACLRAAKRYEKRVVVLDRINPLGGKLVEGRVLGSLTSFVGEYPIPMRHGLSAGEACRFFNREIGAELDVVSIQGWNPEKAWPLEKRPWVMSSPNLPTLDAVLCYPGMVLFEGCNVSEGRGTTKPFQFIGSPYLPSSKDLVDFVHEHLGDVPGVYLRPTSFEPTFGKWRGRECRGVELYVTDRDSVESFRLAIALLKGFSSFLGSCFAPKPAPYEYEFNELPMHFLIGEEGGFQKILDKSPQDAYWSNGLQNYLDSLEGLLLYPRIMKAAS